MKHYKKVDLQISFGFPGITFICLFCMRTLHFIPLSLAALALLVQAAPVEKNTVQIYTTGNEAAEKQGALQNGGGGSDALGQLAEGLKNVKREDDDDDDEDDDDDDDEDDDDDDEDDDDDDEDDDDDDEDDDDGDDLDDKDDDPDGNPNDDNDQLKKGGGGGSSPLLGQQADSLLKTLSPGSHGYHIAGIIKKREESGVAAGPHIQKLKAHHHKDADGEDPGDGIHGDDDDDDDDDGDDDDDEA